jgi:hypothetical protein
LWALAFLRIIRHSSLFSATLLRFFTARTLMSWHTHTLFPSQFWSSHFPCSFWFGVKCFLDGPILASTH